MNTIESLQALYVKLGGSLTDTYEDIAGGVPVSDYSIIPDMIAAVSRKATGSGTDDTVFTYVLASQLYTASGYQDRPYCFLEVRIEGQGVAGGLDNITAEELHTQLLALASQSIGVAYHKEERARNAQYLINVFSKYNGQVWTDDEALLAVVRAEEETEYALFSKIADIISKAANSSDLKPLVVKEALAYYPTKNDVMTVTLTLDADNNLVASKTGGEILTALITDKKQVLLLRAGNGYERYIITNASFSGPPEADYFITAFTVEGHVPVYLQAQRDAENGGALFVRSTG